MQLENSVGLIKPSIAKIDKPLQLERGESLASYQIVYETYGQLNKNKSNAILVCHALSSNHHAAGFYRANDKASIGWWETMIGPNKPIDTNRFYVVCCNNLGGCGGSTGPSSINPASNKPYGPDFPAITVKDWVNSQAQLSDVLGIKQWAAVIGGSLGGMQVLQWSIDYPDRINNAIVIASAAKLTAQNIGFNDVARQAIITDSDFHDGHYYEHNTSPKRGLRIARMLGHITYLSDNIMAQKFGRNLRAHSQPNLKDSTENLEAEFEVESYLRYQGDRFVNSFDANTYVLMTRALDYFDPAVESNNQLSVALKTAKADFLVVSFTSDWRFSPERSREIVRALHTNNLNVSYAELNAEQGHDSFLLNIPEYFEIMHAYMNKISTQIDSTLDTELA